MKALLAKPGNDSPWRKNLPPPVPVPTRPIAPISDDVLSLQRKPTCACGGGCPRCQNELPVQTKLAISQPGDVYEQGAERIADKVMRMSESRSSSNQLQSETLSESIAPLVQTESEGGAAILLGLTSSLTPNDFILMSQLAMKVRTDGARRILARPARSGAFTKIFPLPIFDSGIQRKPACACGGGCQRCKDKLPSQANLAASRPMTGFVRKVEPAYDGKSDCSPTWFGDTSPEVDPSGGSFTGKLIVKYNDAALKSPCVRDCVEEHEAVHVAHLTPIVEKIHECDVAAGSDWEKKGKCNEMASRDLAAIQKHSECEAYRKSFTCLTLKVLDSKSPCSKPPHRDEVQKHRGYEACEMRRYCAEAGTPELGIPNA